MVRDINAVRDYWTENPCNSDYSVQQERKKYFEEVTYKRFQGREWHVPIIARFEDFRNKDVLEIGCGIGTDGEEFAKNGARYVGIDLSPSSIELSKERFRLNRLRGTFIVANAEERLPFPNNSFDHIYSFGVIHHTPNPQKVGREMYRVLRPSGTFCVMLYNRSSINYYIEIMFLRKLLRWTLYPSFMPGLVSRVTGLSEWKLRDHRRVMTEHRRMTKEEWISINTDGPHCPLSRVYGKKEAADLFSMFGELTQEVWGFNTEHWSFLGRLLPAVLARKLGRLWGWHRIVYGRKPSG